MSNEILKNLEPERNFSGQPLDPEILGKLSRLFYELPENAVAYCDVVTAEGDRRRITRHPEGQSHFVVSGHLCKRDINLADPENYSGLYILPGTLAEITRDSTDEGLERIRSRHAVNALLRLSIG